MGMKILFTGDVVITKETNDSSIISDSLKEVWNEQDIVCCNLEGPVINQNMNVQKKVGPNIFNLEDNVKKIIDSGCNLFCLANNHIYDYGLEGIKNTIKICKKYNTDFIGAGTNLEDIYKVYRKQMNGINIAIINIAENGFGAAVDCEYGYLYMFDKKVFEMIKKLHSEVDYIITICHAGAENWKVPLPEIREFYKMLIDIGVDVVIGHHPHVPQGIEEYNSRINIL